MNVDRALKPLNVVPRLLGSMVAIGVGLWWISIGLGIHDLGDIGSPGDAMGPLIFGAVAVCGGLFGIVRAVMTAMAPTPRDERAPEGSDTLTFDADAAIERYLAQKNSGEEPFPVENVPRASRPVFGRKPGAPAS